jgi:two-component system nitrogen regulation sensor histidine kinase GlnL
MRLYLILSSFLVSVVTLFFLVSVLIRGGAQRRNLAFCWFAISVLVWICGYFFWQLSDSESEAIFWIRILIIGSSFVPYTYLHFVNVVTGRRSPILVSLGVGIAVILSCLSFSPYICSGVEERMGMPYWPVAGPAFALYFGGFALVVLYCYVLLIQQYRSASEKVRNQNKYLIIGTAIGFFGGATNFPLWLGIPMLPWGHGLSIFYIMGIGYSVVRYHLLDFNEMAVRLLGLIVASGALGAGMAGCLLLLNETIYFEGEVGSFIWLWTVFSVQSFFFLLIGQWVYNLVNNLVQARFISSRYAYRNELKELSGRVVSGGVEDELLEEVVQRLYEIMNLDYSSVILRSELESGYRCKASAGTRLRSSIVAAADLEPVVAALGVQHHAVFLEEQMDTSPSFREKIASLLADGSPVCATDVLFAISAKDRLYGFLILGSSGRSGAFADVDVLLLENLCSQMGLALKSREMERTSNQVDKLVSLGTMAAGLSHELRNPLVSIRTLASLLQKHSGELSLKASFNETVQRDVRRVMGIVEGVATFSKDTTGPMALVDMNAVIHEVEGTLAGKLKEQQVELQIVSEVSPLTAIGNMEQLIQVFRNIVENAINAIAEWEDRPAQGRICIRVRRRDGSSIDPQKWVEVEVSDNGPGISAEYKSRLFDPFVTTRDTGHRVDGAGTGLGLAIVNNIVEYHGGVIKVSSELGFGAKFRVFIPGA